MRNPKFIRCSHKALEWRGYKKNKKRGDGLLPPVQHCVECEESIRLKAPNEQGK